MQYGKMMALAMLAGLVAACGGGSGDAAPSPGGGSSAPAPAPSVTPLPAPAPAPAPSPAPAVQVPPTPLNLSVDYGAKSYTFSWGASAGATHYELFEDADGAGPQPAVRVGGDVPTTSARVDLAASLLERLNARYSLRACNTAGCSAQAAPVTPDVSRAIGYFKASNTDAGDRFGSAVAVSADGSTMAVGAPMEASAASGIGGNAQDDSLPGAGAVYVFGRQGGAWTQLAYVKASQPERDAFFGASVALSGDGQALAVGAPGQDRPAHIGTSGLRADDSGVVYLFTRSGTAWSQETVIFDSEGPSLTAYGSRVALSQDGATLAVGSPGDARRYEGVRTSIPPWDRFATIATNVAYGGVHVYTRVGATWALDAYIKAEVSDPGAMFGDGLALSGDGKVLAVGAPGPYHADWGVGETVSMYARGMSGWSLQQKLRPAGLTENNRFGGAVALSGDGSTVAVGANWESGGGRGVDAVAASSSERSGAVYVYRQTSPTAWTQQAYLKSSNASLGDWFGASVALSADGNILVAGAPLEDSAATGINGGQSMLTAANSGAAYVFGRSGTTWSQGAYLKAGNASQWFGGALGLSADGRMLAVGAAQEDQPGTGIQAPQAAPVAPEAGAVYLY